MRLRIQCYSTTVLLLTPTQTFHRRRHNPPPASVTGPGTKGNHNDFVLTLVGSRKHGLLCCLVTALPLASEELHQQHTRSRRRHLIYRLRRGCQQSDRQSRRSQDHQQPCPVRPARSTRVRRRSPCSANLTCPGTRGFRIPSPLERTRCSRRALSLEQRAP